MKIYKIEMKNSQNHIIDQNSRIKKIKNWQSIKFKKMQNDKSVEFTTCRLKKMHKEQNSKMDSWKIGKHRIDKVQNQQIQN